MEIKKITIKLMQLFIVYLCVSLLASLAYADYLVRPVPYDDGYYAEYYIQDCTPTCPCYHRSHCYKHKHIAKKKSHHKKIYYKKPACYGMVVKKSTCCGCYIKQFEPVTFRQRPPLAADVMWTYMNVIITHQI